MAAEYIHQAAAANVVQATAVHDEQCCTAAAMWLQLQAKHDLYVRGGSGPVMSGHWGSAPADATARVITSHPAERSDAVNS